MDERQPESSWPSSVATQVTSHAIIPLNDGNGGGDDDDGGGGGKATITVQEPCLALTTTTAPEPCLALTTTTRYNNSNNNNNNNNSHPRHPHNNAGKRPPRTMASISWGTVTIHQHLMELGDHPCVTCGVPVTLQWTTDMTPVTLNLDDYEDDPLPEEDGDDEPKSQSQPWQRPQHSSGGDRYQRRRRRRRTGLELLIPEHVRYQVCLQALTAAGHNSGTTTTTTVSPSSSSPITTTRLLVYLASARPYERELQQAMATVQRVQRQRTTSAKDHVRRWSIMMTTGGEDKDDDISSTREDHEHEPRSFFSWLLFGTLLGRPREQQQQQQQQQFAAQSLELFGRHKAQLQSCHVQEALLL
ncbi:hypothetical protein ACA910_014994 [Epithemia clementina (nom. ined.)]